MASGPAPIVSTRENTNYARLCRLLIDVGSAVLRDTFIGIHPPANLPAILSGTSVESTLKQLRRKKFLNPIQWGKLYPATPSTVSSSNFDITLLMILLRNICGLSPPSSTGSWDKLPPASDNGIEDNIARIKYYRNSVYGHAPKASVDDPTFNMLWQDISNAMLALEKSYAPRINRLKTESMDPDEEKHYKGLLMEWKKDDDSTKEKLEAMEEMMKSHQDNTNKKLEELKGMMKLKDKQEMEKKKPSSELPEEPSNIYGHSMEVDMVVDALSGSGPSSGVLVSGIAGIGKTTVAIQAGHKLKDKYQRIVKFCSLRDVYESEMGDEWREILNVCVPGHQQTNEKPRHVLLSWCRCLEYDIILILDNAEDYMEDLTRDFISMLRELKTCSESKIKFLITSRSSSIASIRLKLAFEHVPLEPLEIQDSVEVLKVGVELPSDIPSEQANSSLVKLAQVCENIPLALRLAGPLLSESEYTFEEFVDELVKNATETLGLEGIMEMAFEKLDETLKNALVCLSVFVHSFDKRAAEAVFGDKCAKHLTKLKQRCLIQKQDDRYLLHLLIRSFVRERGKRDDLAGTLACGQQRFVEHFLLLLSHNSSKFWGNGTCKESLDFFNKERINLESTLEQVCEKKIGECRELKDIVKNCQQVASYIEYSVPFKLYYGFLRGLLHFSQKQRKAANQVEILLLLYHESRKHGTNNEKESRGYISQAISMYTSNSELFKQEHLSRVIYLSHYGRYLSQDLKQREKAQAFLREAVEILEENKLGASFDKARILTQIGHNEKFKTDEKSNEEARKCYEEALSFRQKHYGEHFWTAFAHKDFADFYLYKEDLDNAKGHYGEAIRILDVMGALDQKESIPVYKNFGICLQKSNKFEESRRIFKKGCGVADSTIEGDHKWKVWIKTCFALLLYEEFPEELAAADKISEDVLKMGKELNLGNWHKKGELEKRFHRKV
ncbi:uncharacterized protein LOC114951463 isoform X2 [Acropora millepora]|uniref:uncharacterized protein LOC114951463 isoform X2 n=1 Tax=Acropora millepora TaxID=45264 RepID=UPI001CF3EB1B|nr:uncharacterized protein LOC114951463 isoform X2 [Acropora millepora]